MTDRKARTCCSGPVLRRVGRRLRGRGGPDPRTPLRPRRPDGPPSSWAGATASWPTAPNPAAPGGSTTTSPGTSRNDIGAEIMGRNKFGPQRGPWEDHEWQGWWGDDPPFHTPVFVLTHHERPVLHARRTPPSTSSTPPRPKPSGQAKEAADGQGRAPRRRRGHHPRVPRRRPGRHDARRGRPGRARPRRAPVGLARRAARPLPPRHRPQPQRGDPPALLAALSARASTAARRRGDPRRRGTRRARAPRCRRGGARPR